jgi:hypothetical protein
MQQDTTQLSAKYCGSNKREKVIGFGTGCEAMIGFTVFTIWQKASHDRRPSTFDREQKLRY